MTHLTLTYTHHYEDDPTITYVSTIQRDAETLTRDQMLDAFEDLLRVAGFACEKDTLGFPEPSR